MKEICFVRAMDIYNDSRATKEITALVENGYHVTVLGWNRLGGAPEECERVFNELSESISFHFFDCYMPSGIGFRNIDKLYSWIRWVRQELENVSQPVAVHACDLNSGISAYKFCKAHGIKLIYDIFDYYIDSHNVPNILRWYVEGLEIEIINNAAITIICTEERKEQISKSHPKKLLVIHNSPEIGRLQDKAIVNDYVYCGLLGGRRLVNEILDEYADNIDLKFLFAGTGKLVNKVEAFAVRYANLEFLGSIPYVDVIKYEAQSRVVSAIYEPSSRNHRLCAPNKFYEAMALAKPVIVCRGTGIDKIVEQEKIGIVIDYDAKQFYEAVRYLKANPQICEEMGKRGRRLYEEKYNWGIMKDRLINAYRELLGE